MTGTQRVLVVGAGMAGLRSVESLRAAGFAGEVVVVGKERWAPYNRPPLSKDVLRTTAGHADVAFRPRSTTSDVTWRLGEEVAHVDLGGRVATLTDGGLLGFHALVAASGVSARRLAVPGPDLDAPGRHVVRTLDDALALRAELRPGTRVVVVGAGFVGCEVALAARARGCLVDCVAADERPLVRPLGVELAAEVQRRHERAGLTFHLGTGVRALLGQDRVEGVVTHEGTVLPAAVVVEAVGSRPASDWLAGQGLDLSDGVLTDPELHPLVVDPDGGPGTPPRHVVVVGDLARFPNPRFSDGAHRVEHWSTAADTGRRAGLVLAAELRGGAGGRDVPSAWEVLPSFWSDQGDLRLQSYGMPGLGDPAETRLLEGSLSTECVVGYHRDGELLGVVGLGRSPGLAAYRSRVGRGLRAAA